MTDKEVKALEEASEACTRSMNMLFGKKDSNFTAMASILRYLACKAEDGSIRSIELNWNYPESPNITLGVVLPVPVNSITICLDTPLQPSDCLTAPTKDPLWVKEE